MTYVDHHLANADIYPLRGLFLRIHSGIKRSRYLAGQTGLSFISFLANHAEQRGPTPSGSILVYSGIAVACSALYDALSSDVTGSAHPTTRQPLCQRGCLRRVVTDIQFKAVDEIRLHRHIIARRINPAHANGRAARHVLRATGP
jgi:hypothetical protein